MFLDCFNLGAKFSTNEKIPRHMVKDRIGNKLDGYHWLKNHFINEMVGLKLK